MHCRMRRAGAQLGDRRGRGVISFREARDRRVQRAGVDECKWCVSMPLSCSFWSWLYFTVPAGDVNAVRKVSGTNLGPQIAYGCLLVPFGIVCISRSIVLVDKEVVLCEKSSSSNFIYSDLGTSACLHEFEVPARLILKESSRRFHRRQVSPRLPRPRNPAHSNADTIRSV